MEGAEDWGLFRSGLTRAVASLIEAIDEERLSTLRALELPETSLAQWIARYYFDDGVAGPGVYGTLTTAPVFARSKGPRTLMHRHVSEDVPFGLVPMAEIAHAVGVHTPCTDALIELLSAAMRHPFRREGRTAERMGLAGLRRPEILALAFGGM